MDIELTRRRLLAGVVGGGALLGGGRATYNVALGYDRVTGTNLKRQDLDPLVAERLGASGAEVATTGDYTIRRSERTLSATNSGSTVASVDVEEGPTAAGAIDDELGLEDRPFEQLAADLSTLEEGDVRFVYDSYPAFFDLITDDDHEPRPYTVNALRGYKTAAPAIIETFTGADPADPMAVAEGLVDGFREHTHYDVSRYLAGSVEDNVIFGRRDLRQHFESETDFEAMLEGEDGGLFCYELTRRSVEALQAVPAPDQTAPVVAGFVNNRRHKHVYTIVASAVRNGEGELVIPVTFLDYTHSTLYDDLRLRRITGEGLDAYDTRHRATGIAWYH